MECVTDNPTAVEKQTYTRPAVLIPAFRPTASLIQLCKGLSQKGYRCLVVDDGSGVQYRALFDQAGAIPHVNVVHREVNRGKGAALKAGVRALLASGDAKNGIVTADADGQHHIDDIDGVARRLSEQPDHLILGCRQFDADVPWKSRLGNSLTRLLFKTLVGYSISDTQTGLRGIPASLAPDMMRLRQDQYDFEFEMLIRTLGRVPHAEVPIRTIYEEGNRGSFFNPFLDSVKIYFLFLRFVISSLTAFVLDYVVFSAVFFSKHNLLGAYIVSRTVSGIVNYRMNQRFVFHAEKRRNYAAARYIALIVALGLVSWGFVHLLVYKANAPVLWSKLFIEALLFALSFFLQKYLVFGSRRDRRA